MLSRNELRGELTRKRRVYVPGHGTFPICCICGEPIKGGGEIHDSIITRGMIRNADKVHLILVPENSNLVHSDCHPESGRGSELDLHTHEGYKVLEWLERIQEEFPALVGQVRYEYHIFVGITHFL
ncbi:MAG: hypothetical protein WCK35_14270 [Chloroflexota bacterium]